MSPYFGGKIEWRSLKVTVELAVYHPIALCLLGKHQSLLKCRPVWMCFCKPGAHCLVFTCCVFNYVTVPCSTNPEVHMMAVPFALPEDEINNLIAAVIFILTQTRLEREENHELQECMEELVRLLVEELERRSRSSEYDNQLRQTLYLLRRSLNQFSPSVARMSRRRSNSESSCCFDTAKPSLNEVDGEDCSQVGLILRKIADDDEPSAIFKGSREEEKEFVEETLFSRLVPGVKRTFWTAVPLICMVGWHLFQTSYCM